MALDDRRHPDAEQLAEYADGVLGADVRADVETHLVECVDCRTVLAETMAFVAAERVGEQASATSGARVVPFRSRRWVTGALAGLAAAAALMLGVRVARPDLLDQVFGGDRPELQELMAAVANEPTRPVDGRLSGGFKYAAPPSPTRGPGDREVSPDVRIAAAKIEKLATAEDSAAHRAALGVARLATGQADQAVAALERAVEWSPQNARFQNDLAAAYLARSERDARPDDVPNALAAADRALKTDPALVEASFNRALALERLRRVDDARHAWEAYIQTAPQSPWTEEARRHLDALTDNSRR